MTYYFAQNATIEVLPPNSSKYKVVGAAQEVSIDTEFEVEEMYEFRSILRTTASRHHATVNVKVSTAQFGQFNDDPAWFWAILSSAGITETSFTPRTGETKTAHQITIEDSTNLPMFSIVGQWTSDDGTETIYGRVTGVYFKNFSWGGALGEYIIEELEGTGSQVMFTTDKDYAVGGDASTIWSNVGARITCGGVEVINASTHTATFTIDNYAQYASKAVTSSNEVITASADTTTGVVTLTNLAGSSQFANIIIACDGMSKIVPVTLGANATPSKFRVTTAAVTGVTYSPTELKWFDSGVTVSATSGVLTVGTKTITATAASGTITGFTLEAGGELPSTLTADIVVKATKSA